MGNSPSFIYPPIYYQAILIKEGINQQVLLEKFGIKPDKAVLEILEEKDGPFAEINYSEGLKKTKKKKEKEVPKVIHESNQRLPNSWDL